MKKYVLLLSFLFISFSQTVYAQKLNVLIVAEELTGFKAKDGIGTYNYYLAQFLKKQGHTVNILYVGLDDGKDIQAKNTLYQGINFLSLPNWTDAKIVDQENVAKSFQIYRFLKDKKYDVIFFGDYQGYGFYLTEAKRQGYAFAETLLIGTVHGPKEWLWDIGNISEPNVESYLTAHVEEKSMANPDILLVPSKYAYDFLKRKGWKYPKDTQLLPAIFETKNVSKTFPQAEISEIVFIGRLSSHKGYDLFSKMCKRAYTLQSELIKKLKITFIGAGSTDEFKKLNPELAANVHHITNFSAPDVEQYIAQPNRLVVFTSRAETFGYAQAEAIYNNVKFIGLKNGAFEELINSDDVDMVLTPALNPNPLAQKLCDILASGKVPQIRPNYSIDDIEAAWKKLDAHIVDRVNEIRNVKETVKQIEPLVSVCIAHYNRPDQLMEALKSLEEQDYKNFEVLVMDDGSTPKVKEELKRIVEPYMHKKGWRLFYQENQYLSAARNNLIPHTNGEYFLFMDDDNIALKDEISRFVRIAHKTKADLVVTNLFIATGNKFVADIIKLVFSDALTPNVTGINYLGDANVLISKSAFKRIGKWHDVYGFGYSDQKLIIDAVSNKLRIEVSVEPTFIYNSVGEEHMTAKDFSNINFQNKVLADSYAKMLPHELRHLPFLTYSLYQENARFNINNISLRHIIKDRIYKKINSISDKMKTFFTRSG